MLMKELQSPFLLCAALYNNVSAGICAQLYVELCYLTTKHPQPHILRGIPNSQKGTYMKSL